MSNHFFFCLLDLYEAKANKPLFPHLFVLQLHQWESGNKTALPLKQWQNVWPWLKQLGASAASPL